LEFEVNADGKLVGKNDFYQMLTETFSEQAQKMFIFGRRNVSWSTCAPTGSLSILAKLITYCNMTGGMEPIFACYYLRNKKVNVNEHNVRIDFTDQNGDSWTTYPVVMGGFKEWLDITYGENKFESFTEEEIKAAYEKSPYFNSTANDIDWVKRIEIQSVIQKYTTHSISSTINLPNDVSKDKIREIYLESYMKGLKGVTVYRDGCRTGVLVTSDKKEEKTEFNYKDSIKRPKELTADLHSVTVKGNKYIVIVGLMNDKPYEIFATHDKDNVYVGKYTGKISKLKKGSYTFQSNDKNELSIENLDTFSIHAEEQVLSRLISGMLRHGAKPQFVIEQIDKCELEVISFGKAVSRVLKKYCNEEEMIARATCENCGSTDLIMQEGCLSCRTCGNSKCG